MVYSNKRLLAIIVFVALLVNIFSFVPLTKVSAATDASLALWYKLDETSGTTVYDSSGNNRNGTLSSGTTFTTDSVKGGVASFSGSNSYITLPSGFISQLGTDITVSMNVYDAVKLTNGACWYFGFGTGSSGRYMLLGDVWNQTQFSITSSGSSGESFIKVGSPRFNVWKHLAVTLSGGTAIMYEDGVEIGRKTGITLTPQDLGADTYNYIGKSLYSGDAYFTGKIDDFRIYSRALSAAEIAAVMSDQMSDSDKVAAVKAALTLGDTSAVKSNLTLPAVPAAYQDVSVAWNSDNTAVVANDGTVTQPPAGAGSATAHLTATITKGSVTDTKVFTIVVLEVGAAPYTMAVDAGTKGVDISPTLIGAFFEDINYGADGGLYAELVKNRSFEFKNNYLGSWTLVQNGGGTGTITTQTAQPLNAKNPRYLELNVANPGTGVGVSNSGFGGIAVQKDKKYNFTVYVKSNDYSGPIDVKLQGANGTVYAQAQITGITASWQKLSCTLTSNTTDSSAVLAVTASANGTIDMDMVSLFPQDTYKNRPNGLRADMVQILKDMKPKFLRFPGGCIVEGFNFAKADGDNPYNWKDSIGDVAERPINDNRWNHWPKSSPDGGYYQSYGLGFFEYFQLCEDIGAEPIPIVNCGMTCQWADFGGPAETIPLNQLQPYIQDALDLIEYANGDVTTTWGAKRAAAGHPEPFNLKYLGVGNEQWGSTYYERYDAFQKAISAIYPDIKLVFAAGASPNDSNYTNAWNYIKTKPSGYAGLVDEHMYQSSSWFVNNVGRYNTYDRTGAPVFVGEYAAKNSDSKNTLDTALAEAAYITGLERNSDIVKMSSYAPLFNKVTNSQWTPDLIWVNNTSIFGTPDYYTQKMFATNMGSYTLPTTYAKDGSQVPLIYTTSSKDNNTGDIILKVVNYSGNDYETGIKINNAGYINPNGTINVLTSTNTTDQNSMTEPAKVSPVTSSISGLSSSFNYVFKKNSFTIIRIPTKEDAQIISSIPDVSVSTSVGSVPSLPQTVSANFADGQSHTVNVKWDSVDPSQYADNRVFTVEGTVEGTLITAKASVSVVPGTLKPFTITTNGVLDRTSGVKATVSVNLTQGVATHDGQEVVLFQLMRGYTPVSIVALKRDITSQENFTAYFNVDPGDTSYEVRAYVLDSFSNDLTAPVSLAEQVTLQ